MASAGASCAHSFRCCDCSWRFCRAAEAAARDDSRVIGPGRGSDLLEGLTAVSMPNRAAIQVTQKPQSLSHAARIGQRLHFVEENLAAFAVP